MSQNKIIAINSIVSFFRIMVNAIAMLFISRVVLQQLGAIDFGIYNIIGGIVGSFLFINSSMTVASQRYITYGFAENNSLKVRESYINSTILHWLIALFIFIVAESFSSYLIHEVLNIPINRIEIAEYVYQLSILTIVLNIIIVPPTSILFAKEEFIIISLWGMVDIILKITMSILLIYTTYDKLLFYSISLAIINLLAYIFHLLYTSKKYKVETTFNTSINLRGAKEISSFAGWSTLSSIGLIMKSQGINLLLNIFLGPIINAINGIASQIYNQSINIIQTLIRVFTPQIITSYTKRDNRRTFSLVNNSARYAFLVMYFIILPIIVYTKFILTIWLSDYPIGTEEFLRLTLAGGFFLCFTLAFDSASRAVEKIKYYEIIGSLLLSLNIPISYQILKMNLPYTYVLWSILIINILITVFDIILLKKMILYPPASFIKHVIAPCSKVIFWSIISVICIKNYVNNDIIGIGLLVITNAIGIFSRGLTSKERSKILKYIYTIKRK